MSFDLCIFPTYASASDTVRGFLRMEVMQEVGVETLEPPQAVSSRVRVRQGVYVTAAAACLLPWASPGIALAAGVVLAMAMENPFARTSRRVSKILLQVCVVMLGFSMDLNTVLHAGAAGASLAAGSIIITLLLGYALGRLLRIDGKTSTLISTGTAICGGSAIAAVGSVLGAAEAEMAVAMGTVFMLNAVALYLFPVLGHLLHLSQLQFGTWAGVAIHDVASVVGAAAVYGDTALQTATAVKLSRTLWIVPVSLGVALAIRRGAARTGSAEPQSSPDRPSKIRVPWFIGFFVLASVARSLVPGVVTVAPALSTISKAGLTLTLFLIGASLSRSTLAAVGWRALVQGAMLWLVISAGTLALIVWL
jgi:uncharacterized integral membrane protein (TIGR00698 family)